MAHFLPPELVIHVIKLEWPNLEDDRQQLASSDVTFHAERIKG